MQRKVQCTYNPSVKLKWKGGAQFSCDLIPVLCEHDWWRGAQVKVEKEKGMQAEGEALEPLESRFQCFRVLRFLLMHPAADCSQNKLPLRTHLPAYPSSARKYPPTKRNTFIQKAGFMQKPSMSGRNSHSFWKLKGQSGCSPASQDRIAGDRLRNEQKCLLSSQ